MTTELAAAVERLDRYVKESVHDRSLRVPSFRGDIRLILAELERRGRVIERFRSALQFSAGGCLVPPDGGSPDVYDHINNAKAALAYDGAETEDNNE